MPRNAATTSVRLTGVTLVPGTKDLFAVGAWYDSSGSGDVIVKWKGSSWQSMAAPSTPGGLTGVWAASSKAAWAVGYTDTGYQLLEWNGTHWSSKTISGLAASDSLTAVSGSSASDVYAVGSTADGQPIAAHFDGESWTVSPAGPSQSYLANVSAVSSTDAWAAGSALSGAPVVLQWNGSAWKTASVPFPSHSEFGGLSATSSRVWILGDTIGKDDNDTLFSLERIGSKWTKFSMPAPGKDPYPGGGVVTVSKDVAWAAGFASNPANTNFSAFSERFSKGKWSIVSMPSSGNGSSISQLVAAGTSDVWAVGSAFTGKVCSSSEVPTSFRYVRSWTEETVPVSIAAERGATAPHC